MRIVLIAASVTMFICLEAAAHPIAICRGTILMEENCITATIDTCAETFLHEQHGGHDMKDITDAWLQESFRKHGERLARRLILRDGSGERLTGKLTSSSLDKNGIEAIDYRQLRGIHARYILQFPTHTPLRFLTLQQVSDEEESSLPFQLALTVQKTGDVQVQSIRLTSGGNVETLGFDWPPAMVTDNRIGIEKSFPDYLWRRRFKIPLSIVNIRNDYVDVELSLPFSLLETWLTIPRKDADFLTAAENTAACKMLKHFVEQHSHLRLNDAETNGDILQLAIIGPEDFATDDKSSARRTGTWSARLVAVIRTRAKDPMRQLEMRWTLFNPAVLTADAIIVKGSRTEEHQFSTYDPILRRPIGSASQEMGSISDARDKGCGVLRDGGIK